MINLSQHVEAKEKVMKYIKKKFDNKALSGKKVDKCLLEQVRRDTMLIIVNGVKEGKLMGSVEDYLVETMSGKDGCVIIIPRVLCRFEEKVA